MAAVSSAVRAGSRVSAAAATKKAVTTKAVATKKAAKPAAKPAAAKAAPTKAAPTKAAPTKAATRKAAPTKAVAKKAAPTKKTALTKAAATKAAPTKAAPTKAVTRKAAPTKAAATKAAPSNAAPKTTAPAKAATRKTAAPAKAAAKKTATSKAAPAALRVREDESPWTAAELREVREGLEHDVTRLTAEIASAETGLHELLRDSGDGAGDDQADAGAKTFEREQEISLANNSREMLEQSVHALAAIDDGTYGVCESCGLPVGKMRLQAFPRATLCVSCKSRQERR